MKKYLFIALAATALVSCSQDETLDNVQGEAIKFGNVFVGNSTRAIDPSYGADAVPLTQFNVWGEVKATTENGVSIFKNDAVTGTVGNQVWSCDKTQYWIAGASYKFAAVVNGGTDETKFTYPGNLPTAVTFTSTDGQTDLLYADAEVNNVTTGYNTPVNFDFNHMLAKAVFTASNTTNQGDDTNTSNYYYKISDIKILNPKTTGTCTFASKEWTSTSQAEGTAYEFGNITNADKKATTALTTDAIELHDRAANQTSHRECMLIPYNYTDSEKLKISFKVQLYMEKDDTAANDELVSEKTETFDVVVDFQAGYAYSFNISVGIGNPIQFTVTSAPTWETGTGTVITVQ